MKLFRLLAILLLLGAAALAQHTTVTAQVKDPTGLLYRTCSGSASFVGQNNIPGAGPYLLGGVSVFQTVVPITCDSFARFTVSISDNNQITPTPSQWRFTLCSAVGAYPGPPICFTTLITITGISQDITAALQAAAAPLPPYLVTLETNGILNGSQSLLNLRNGSNVSIVDDGVGDVTISASAGGGGGTGLPDPGSNGLVARTALNTTAAVANVAIGSQLVSEGVSSLPVFQTKPVYDVRDWATCNTAVGTSTGTNATAGINTMLAAIGTRQTTVRILGSSNPTDTCLVDTISWPSNVTLDFSGGGAFTLVTTVTPPGGGAVDGSAVGAFNTTTSSCSITLTVPTSGDAIALFSTYHFATGGGLGLPTDTKNDIYRLISSSDADPNHFSTNSFGWVASNVPAGSVTITIPYTASPSNTCGAVAISGLGPSVGADGSGNACKNSCNTNSPMSVVNSATFTAGSFLLSFGGQTTSTETCTAGAGFTQILNVGTAMSLCAQVQNSAAGGAVTPTQAINNPPTSSIWMYNVFGLKPIRATQFIQGGVWNPNLHQVFYQAGAGQGTVDFTGNLIIPTVYPEWWGAASTATVAVNTAAIQAAEHGAFGTGRSNASGLAIYNKQLYLSALYSINDEIQFYDTIGNSTSRWNITCAAGGGIKQTAVNKRIWDGQSNAYGTINRCTFQGSASSTNALIDMDFDGVTTVGDLATQFITCYDCSFVGNGLVDVGWLIAKSGGGAQGSNIYCVNCAGQGFTGAVQQIGGNGTGRNVGRFYAFNALNIGWTGDMQNCPNFGLASYGGGYIVVDNSSFECVSPLATYLTQAATSVDIYGEATQGPVTVSNTRSEDLQLIHASNPKVINSNQIDQSTAFYSPVNCLAGSTEPLNWFIHGSDLGSDGALYQETVHGTAFGGLCLTNASSGTPTTITDTNQRVAGSNTIKTFVVNETATQAVTGSTGTVLNVPISTGTITGSVASGTIGATDVVTQATTGITCTVVAPAPTGSSNLLVNNCSGTADNSHIWTDGITSGTYTPSTAPAFAVASPIMLITAATGAPDNSHNWTGGTSGAVLVPTAVPVADVNWSVNQFVGGAGAQQQVTIWGGAGVGTICSPITANTSTTITFTSCTSNFYGVHTATFNSTTQFIVEPCWGCGVTQSGDFTFAKVTPVIIGGDNVNTSSASCTIQDVQTSGGLIQCGSGFGTFTRIHNLTVSRSDWYGPTSGFKLSDSVISQLINQVQIVRPYSSSAGVGTRLNWSIATRNGGATAFNGPLQSQMGTSPLVWSCGGAGGGTSCNDVSIGGRSDPLAATDTFRNRVEYTGMLGAPAPTNFNLTDQAGVATRIGGGPSTGAGTPGNVEIWTGSTSGSGATVNTGTRKWYWDGATGHLFASADNTNDIGAAGATRPRNIYAGTSLNTGDPTFGSQTTTASSACETSFATTTLSTAATTTDTGLSCLPANSIIDSVVYRITVTITTAANFTIGDATTAARFCGTQSTLTSGTTGVCFVQADQTGAPGPRQVAAAKVRVTTNANPGAGAIRLIVYYHTWTPPTS